MLFALALLSKESAIILLPLFFLVDRRRSAAPRVSGRAAALSIAAGHTVPSASPTVAFPCTRHSGLRGRAATPGSSGSGDGSRSSRSCFGRSNSADAAASPLPWIGFALIPYSFLTYSTQIPSRQVYLASFGLARSSGWRWRRGIRRGSLAAAILILAIAPIGLPVDQEAPPVPGPGRTHGAAHRSRAPDSRPYLGPLLSPPALDCRRIGPHGSAPRSLDPGLVGERTAHRRILREMTADRQSVRPHNKRKFTSTIATVTTGLPF